MSQHKENKGYKLTIADQALKYGLLLLNLSTLAVSSVVFAPYVDKLQLPSAQFFFGSSMAISAVVYFGAAASLIRYINSPSIIKSQIESFIIESGVVKKNSITKAGKEFISQDFINVASKNLGVTHSPDLYLGSKKLSSSAAGTKKNSFIFISEADLNLKISSPNMIKGIVYHELSHVAQNDVLFMRAFEAVTYINGVMAFLGLVTFNPLVSGQLAMITAGSYLFTKMARRRMENISDRTAAAFTGGEELSEYFMACVKPDQRASRLNPWKRVLRNVFDLCSNHPHNLDRVTNIEKQALKAKSSISL